MLLPLEKPPLISEITLGTLVLLFHNILYFSSSLFTTITIIGVLYVQCPSFSAPHLPCPELDPSSVTLNTALFSVRGSLSGLQILLTKSHKNFPWLGSIIIISQIRKWAREVKQLTKIQTRLAGSQV